MPRLQTDGSMNIMKVRHTSEPPHEEGGTLSEITVTEPTGGYGLAIFCGSTVGLLTSHAVTRFYDQPRDFAVLAGLAGVIVGGIVACLGYMRAEKKNIHFNNSNQIKTQESHEGDGA